MSVEPSAFLLKEQELMKLNEEINLKTKSVLMARKKQTPLKVLPRDLKQRQSLITPTKDEPERDESCGGYKIVAKEEQIVTEPPNHSKSKTVPTIPQTLERRNLSSEGLIKFLKSKVTILQDEIDIQQKENLKKAGELQELNQKLSKWEKQREELLAKNNCLQSELKLSEDKIIELELKVKERDNDTARLGKEGEVTRRDLKTLQQTIGGIEKRLLHSQNENEALKVNLASAYEREREVRDQNRAEKDAAEKQIKQLRKQRLSLITAYKQQLLLLDNLRRQNLALEQAKLLEFSEKEFTKILNWEK